jgi:hypothetical protein
MPTEISYKVDKVPDFDQRWTSLPNNGAMFCVPTAAMNWIHYIAKHGWPLATANPITSSSDVAMIRANIMVMSAFMKTDPLSGTSSDEAFEGLVDYLDARWVPAVVTTESAFDSGHIAVNDLAALALVKGLLIVGMGRYQQIGSSIYFIRTSGHAMSVVGLESNGFEADIEVRDPADDTANLNTQSAPRTTSAHLKPEVRNLIEKTAVVLRWGTSTSPFRFVDSWMAILPSFALTNPSANVIVRYTSNFESGSIDTKEFRLPFEGELLDLAIHPSLPSASIILRGSNDIWTLDLARESWSKTATVESARNLTYGGRDRRLFVLRGNDILSFDRAGKALDKLDTGTRVEAISYDQKNDRLLVATSTQKLLALTPTLQKLDQTEVPEVRGTGRLMLSVNGRDATILVSRQNSQEAATLRWRSTGGRAEGHFRLLTEGRTSAAHLDRKGKLFAVEDGKIATFDSDGSREAQSKFDGLPAGPLLKVARSSHNFDPVRSQRKEWRN